MEYMTIQCLLMIMQVDLFDLYIKICYYLFALKEKLKQEVKF